MELTLVGTGHVFDIGPVVERIIATRRPDVVCVELDAVRLQGLEQRRRLRQMEDAGDPRAEEIHRQQQEAIKRLPLVYRMLAKTQQRIADGEGVEAGGEMLAAVDAARHHGLPVACIDVDAQRLIRRAWSEMGFGEKLRFVWVLWRGGGKGSVHSEMEEYQSDPVAYLAKVGEQFPTLKRVLIDERDAHMANAIFGLEQQRDRLPGRPEVLRVVAVVGDGHVEGMLAHLRQGDRALGEDRLEVVRVKHLREDSVPTSPFSERPVVGTEGRAEDASEDTNSVSVSFETAAPPEADTEPETDPDERAA